MRRLGDPEALGIVLQEKTVCQRWQMGGLLYPGPPFQSPAGQLKAQVGCLNVEAPEIHTHKAAHRDAEIHGEKHAHTDARPPTHAGPVAPTPARAPSPLLSWLVLRPSRCSTQPARSTLACVKGMRGLAWRVPACTHTRVWGCQLHLPLSHLFIPTPHWGRNCRRVGRQSLPAFSSLSGLPSGSWGGRSPRPTPAEGEYVCTRVREKEWLCAPLCAGRSTETGTQGSPRPRTTLALPGLSFPQKADFPVWLALHWRALSGVGLSSQRAGA